jgi:hypothetical protein
VISIIDLRDILASCLCLVGGPPVFDGTQHIKKGAWSQVMSKGKSFIQWVLHSGLDFGGCQEATGKAASNQQLAVEELSESVVDYNFSPAHNPRR